MKPDQLIMAFAVFSLVIFVGILATGEIGTRYNGNITDDLFTSEFTQLNETYSLGTQARTQLEGGDQQDVNQDSILRRAYNAIKGTWSVIRLSIPLLSKVASLLHIPVIFVDVAVTILILMLIFGLAYVIYGVWPK